MAAAGAALGFDAEVDRTEASIAPARGGARTPDTCARRPRRRLPRRIGDVLALALSAAVFAVMFLAGIVAGPGTGAGAATPSNRRADHITLVRQSPWVGPKAPDMDLTMELRIQSSAPRADLALTFTVYDPLRTRSAFDETLSGRGLGATTAQSPAIALSAFTTDAQGVTHVTIPVDGDTAATGPGNWTANLGCPPGSCADVYPVKVSLTDTSSSGSGSGTSGAQLITYLVYDDPSVTSQPLRLALVVPLGLAPPTADRAGRVPAPGSSALATLDGLVDAIGASGSVPVTLVPDPATLEHLAATGRSHTVSEIATLSASPTRETLSGSFVPVDAGALVGAGLGDELNAQVRRAAQVTSSPGVALHTSSGAWVATAALGQGAVNVLDGGFGHFVVPPSAVSGTSGPLTTTQPFALAPGPSEHGASPTAMVSDAGVGARLAAGNSGDVALDAVQTLAELSLIYYEAPNLLGPGNTPAPRGVVGVAPAAWAPQATFVSGVLAGLEGNPVIEPVTLDQLFDQVPVGADGQPVTRHPETPTALPAAVVRALHTARARQGALQSALSRSTEGSASVQSLGDLLLAAESSTLAPRQQQAALSGFESALTSQLHGLSVRSDTIRLTAGTASVPITVLRNTPYPVTVEVRLTSDKLRFPRASTQVPGALCRAPQVQSSPDRSSFSALCTLTHSTNAVYVNMQSRTSGDFQIDVQLTSPEGNLVLAVGQLTVRSLSTSAVAIALSVGAAVVLLVWWGRTLWRGKAPPRSTHRRSRQEIDDVTDPDEPPPTEELFLEVPDTAASGAQVPGAAFPGTHVPLAAPSEGEVRVPDESDDDEPVGEVPGDGQPQDREPEGGPDGATATRPEPGTEPARTTDATRAAGQGQGLRQATALMAVGTALSRITGLLRLVALVYAVHFRTLADAYNLANTMPNLVHDIVLGGIVSATFVPVFVSRLSSSSEEEAWDAISAVTSVAVVVIAVASIVFLILSPFIIDAMTAFNRASQAGVERTVAEELLVLFVPQLACYGCISVATALLNARRRFAAPMFVPIVNNVVIVTLIGFGLLVRNPSIGGVYAHRWQLLLLGLGTTLGVVAQPGLCCRASGAPDSGSSGAPGSVIRRCAPSSACRDGPSGWWWPTRWRCS